MLLRRLLLLPLLSPLLAALLVGALNPTPPLRLRLLTWSSPALPIGLWIAGAAAGGAALSGGATALALAEAGGGLRRRVRQRQDARGSERAASRFQGVSGREQEPWDRLERDDSREREPSRRAAQAASWGDGGTAAGGREAGTAGPQRPPGEPAPTVEVPFRVLRRGDGSGVQPAGVARQSVRSDAPGHGPEREAVPEPVAIAMDDDWNAAAEDDW